MDRSTRVLTALEGLGFLAGGILMVVFAFRFESFVLGLGGAVMGVVGLVVLAIGFREIRADRKR